MITLLIFAAVFGVLALFGLGVACKSERYFVEGMMGFVVGLLCAGGFLAMHWAYFA